MLRFVEPHQQRADYRAAGEVERRGRLLVGEPLRLRAPGGIHDSQRDVSLGSHGLNGRAVDQGEGCPQDLMPPHHLVDGAPERGGIHTVLEPRRDWNVVERAVGRELMQEPESLLGIGERHGTASGTARPASGVFGCRFQPRRRQHALE